MIIITEIKTITTDRDMFELQMMTAPVCPPILPASYKESTITREMIEGRRFRNPATGTDMVIGWSKEVQEVLQMPFEAFDNMQRRMSQMGYDISHANEEIRTYSELVSQGEKTIREFENLSVFGFIKYKIFKYWDECS